MVEPSLAVAPMERGQGIAPDAIATVLDLAFDEWNLDRVQLRCEVDNARAVALYEDLSLIREATLRDATYTGGAYADQHLYARVRSDPR
jgi:RimJ/RimL family protein N-acetyltransferase